MAGDMQPALDTLFWTSAQVFRHDGYPSVDGMFSKTFQFDSSHFRLPDAAQIFSAAAFDDAPLIALRSRLNATRDQLNGNDIDVWHGLTRRTNPANDIMPTLRRVVDPELCTRAWSKLFEMLALHPLLPDKHYAPLATVHVCEAPGGFIAATNHKLRQMYGTRLDWRWIALTLNPYYEFNDPAAMIDDDQFVLHTLEHWYFGEDNSGNIMNRENIRGLWERAHRLDAPAMFFTGDGSVDSSAEPNEQESNVAALHYAEAVCALGTLSPGGSLVLKMFTLFEHSSVCLLYLLGGSFERLVVTKPATSTHGNAEVYIIGLGFRGVPEALRDALLAHVGKAQAADKAMLPREHLTDTFMGEMRKCAALFSGLQCRAIERNLQLERAFSVEAQHFYAELRASMAKEYLRRTGVQRIPPDQRVVVTERISNRGLNSSIVVSDAHGHRKRPGGTLEERRAARIAHDAHVHSTALDAERPQPDAPHVAPGPAPTYSAFAQQQMQQMGHTPLAGLGANEHGIVEPIAVEARSGRSGLGFDVGSAALDGHNGTRAGRVAMLRSSGAPLTNGSWVWGAAAGALPPDEPFFEATDERESCLRDWWADDNGQLLHAMLANRWKPVVGTWQPCGVILSKYARSELLQLLTQARERYLVQVLAAPETTRLAADAALFPAAAIVPAAARPAARLAHLLRIFAEPLHLDAHAPLLFAHLPALGGDLRSAARALVQISANRTVRGVVIAQDRAAVRMVDGTETGPGTEEGALESDSHADYPVGELVRQALDLLCGERPSLCIADAAADTATEVSGRRDAEERVKQRLVRQLCIALELLVPGGALVLRMSDHLTRFSTSALLVLHASFKSIRIAKPFSCAAWESERYVLCSGYAGPKTAAPFLGLLRHVQLMLRELQDAHAADPGGQRRTVLFFAPQDALVAPTLLRTLVPINERLIVREAAALRCLYDQLQQPLERSSAWRAEREREARKRMGDLSAILTARPIRVLPPNWGCAWSRKLKREYFFSPSRAISSRWEWPA